MRCVFPIEPGRLAVSKAGRDAGRVFVVIAPADERHVLLADGDLRKFARPKKKKITHLAPLARVESELGARLTAGAAVADHELREAINRYRQQEEER